MAVLGLDLVVATGLDDLSIPLPDNSWLGVSGEWDLDDSILALVEECRVAEPGVSVIKGFYLSLVAIT
jgi:hypothetical protein